MLISWHRPHAGTTRAAHAALAAGIALVAFATTSAAAASPRARSTPKTRTVQPNVHTADQFVAQAAARSLAGLELSDLALSRSENAAVRRLATETKAEQAHTYETLRGLATGAGMTAAPPETIDLEQRGIKTRLAALSGDAFNRAYIDALRTNDDRDIALYRAYAHDAKDAALKSWIDEQLVTIRRRRQRIEAAAQEVPGARR